MQLTQTSLKALSFYLLLAFCVCSESSESSSPDYQIPKSDDLKHSSIVTRAFIFILIIVGLYAIVSYGYFRRIAYRQEEEVEDMMAQQTQTSNYMNAAKEQMREAATKFELATDDQIKERIRRITDEDFSFKLNGPEFNGFPQQDPVMAFLDKVNSQGIYEGEASGSSMRPISPHSPLSNTGSSHESEPRRNPAVSSEINRRRADEPDRSVE